MCKVRKILLEGLGKVAAAAAMRPPDFYETIVYTQDLIHLQQLSISSLKLRVKNSEGQATLPRFRAAIHSCRVA